MKTLAVRRRSPRLEDARIICLGIWGFILQTFLTLTRREEDRP